MKCLYFDYYMEIDYTDLVSKCNYTIKCIPQTNSRQRIEDLSIDMYPPSTYSWGKDGLGNSQIYGANETPHKTFYFHITGKATTGLAKIEEKENDSLTMIFKHPYGLNVAGEELKKYYDMISKEERLEESDVLTKALGIMHRIHKDYAYVPGSTDINTSAEEAFRLGQGVCQDYAHIFIALLHLSKIPSRYVTGLIVGEGASHAWVEILINGEWIGLDPTNDVMVSTEHIKIGVGRDARDCMINRGIMHGGGFHTQKISVSVKEI